MYEQKLNRRKAAIAKTTSLTEAQKTDVLECLVPEVMSSEESDPDTSNSQFITRPLPWRSDKVNRLFQGLDRKSMKHKSRRSKLMEFERIVGIPSDRPQPPFLSEWICKS